MSGRKPLYDTETLEIGEKMQLSWKARKFKDQYLYAFNNKKREIKKKFKAVSEGNKVFIERIL